MPWGLGLLLPSLRILFPCQMAPHFPQLQANSSPPTPPAGSPQPHNPRDPVSARRWGGDSGDGGSCYAPAVPGKPVFPSVGCRPVAVPFAPLGH